MSPSIGPTGVLSVDIRSNGKEIQDWLEILSITVSQRLDTVAEAVIAVRENGHTGQAFSATDSGTFAPGTHIEIGLGYDGETGLLFKGFVARQRIEINDVVGSALKASCIANTPAAAGVPATPGLEFEFGKDIFELDIAIDPEQSSVLAKYHGWMRIPGDARINVGDTLRLKGIGDRFSSDVFISHFTHEIAQGNWLTQVHFGVPAESVAKP